jgi:transposase
MDTITTPPARRRSTASFRAEIVESCLAPGANIPDIARAHGIRLELLRRWIRKHPAQNADAPPTQPRFLPIQLGPGQGPVASGPIHIEIRRGDTHIHIHAPITATTAATDWLREYLK